MSDILKSYLKNILSNSSFLSLFINNFSNIKVNFLDDLFIIYFNNSSSSMIPNNILSTFNICIFNKNLSIYYLDYKPIFINKNNLPSDVVWKDVNVYENIGNIGYLLNYNNKIYIIYFYENIYKIYYLSDSMFSNINIDATLLNSNTIEKISIIYQKYNRLLYFKNNEIYCAIEKYKDKKIFFSCFDELLFDLEKNSHIMELKKKLFNNGFIIEYFNTTYIINSNIYQKIYDMLPIYSNINKCYIELYKNDNLSFLVNFMSSYPHEIINRVNQSIKTLAKELLNIYHYTRKKQNSTFYNLLSNKYKTILFDLHKIFLYAKSVNNDNNDNNNDDDKLDFLDKPSINIDVIYKYLKKINTDLLISLYIERDKLTNDVKNIEIDYHNFNLPPQFKLIINDCTFTKTMSKLLTL